MKVQSVKGTRDLLPPETAVWAAVEEVARQMFGRYGYGEIRTPILEKTELFVRSVGESTDIVGKEMYTFDDRKGRSLTLRPESTAAVARAFVEHRLAELPPPVRLFYIGPQFRYERPQKGRYRQFHQIGAELIGDPGPESDVEILSMLVRFFEELGFENLVISLNTVGDEASRAAYRQALVEFLEPHRDRLGEDSRRRLESNPLRILDTKIPAEREIVADAPELVDFLSPESRQQFDAVCAGLDALGLRYRLDPRLVRGLDYYNKTVFEIASAALGAQDAIVGGGRYDGLLDQLGGRSTPGIGFAIGFDRLIDILPESFRAGLERRALTFVTPIGDVPASAALLLAEELRRDGIDCVAEFSNRSLKSALRKADRSGATSVVLLGEDELSSGQMTVKSFVTGEQRQLPRAELAASLRRSQESDNAANANPTSDKPNRDRSGND